MANSGSVDPTKPATDISAKTNQQLQTQLSDLQNTKNTTQKFSYIMISSISRLIDFHVNMQNKAMLNINIDSMFAAISNSLSQAKTFPEALQYLNNSSTYIKNRLAKLNAQLKDLQASTPGGTSQQIKDLQALIEGSEGIKTWLNEQLESANAENTKITTEVKNANAEHAKLDAGGTQHTAGFTKWFTDGAHHHYNTTAVCRAEWHDFENNASIDRQAGLNALNVAGGKENKSEANKLNSQFSELKGLLTDTHTLDAIVTTLGKMGQGEANH